MEKKKKSVFIYLTTWSEDGLTEVKIPIQVIPRPKVPLYFELTGANNKVIYHAKGLRKGWVYIKESVDEIYNKITEAKKIKTNYIR